MNSVGRNPWWSMWAWPITTASRSSKLMLSQSRRGYASRPDASPGLMPQSSITLLSGVTTRKHDLPTCFTPPRQNSITSSRLVAHCGRGETSDGSLLPLPFSDTLPTTSEPLNSRLPSFCRKSVLSLAELFKVEWMVLMLVEGMWGERRVCAIQPVLWAICTIIAGSMASCLLTSSTTSPVASSQNTAETCTSFGKSFATAWRVLSSGRRTDGSVRIMNLFFRVFESDDK